MGIVLTSQPKTLKKQVMNKLEVLKEVSKNLAVAKFELSKAMYCGIVEVDMEIYDEISLHQLNLALLSNKIETIINK